MQSRIPNWLPGTIVAVSLVGFSDCVYLLAKRVAGGPIPCFITTGCDTVSNSAYSVLFGIPLVAWGILFYLTVGFLTLLYWDTKKEIFLRLVSAATVIGFIMSTYFVFLQAFVIKAFCVYCLGSAATSTTLFVLGMIILRKLKKQ